MSKAKTAISPTRSENYPEWYQQVVAAGELAENSAVRGCMVIKPWGLSVWENIKTVLDKRLKETGHKNAYFPLFIPVSYLAKEAEHVEGFAKECAVITHHRLEVGPDGGLVPAGPLEEPLVVRPTSETIIGESFSRWIESHRDLPLLINQWANVVRWEMRTRLFLRTTEFLWQEGHTAHADSEDAMRETRLMHDVYTELAENVLAMPVIAGEKTSAERFPGADNTFTIEAMMQDRKALQSGTAHFLGQNFAKSNNIRFTDKDDKLKYVFTTSWGVSTRLVGGVIMTHSDDDGFVCPPRIAPTHVVLLPILFKAEDPNAVMDYCEALAKELRAQTYAGREIEVEIDARDISGGEKLWSWIKKGVPVRVEVGPRDMAKNAVFMGRRDKPHREKTGVDRAEFVTRIPEILAEIQTALHQRALEFRREHTRVIDTEADFLEFFTPGGNGKGPTPIHGGFAISHFCGDSALEEKIKKDHGVTVRCIPNPGQLDQGDDGAGACIFTGKPSKQRLVWAKAY
jgi:prolyl-tRNA synthetase